MIIAHMHKDIIKEKVTAYQNAFKKNRGSVRSLMWNSYVSASKRYKELVSEINFNNYSVLDVGCGFGDIIDLLLNKKLFGQNLPGDSGIVTS